MSGRSSHRESALGAFLRGRRAKLDPAAFGLPLHRRRTPGLRREEVAHRANVSATWYTWLEQGRGGAPSADVLDRIAKALMLTEDERQHLFLLGLGRLPQVRYQIVEGVSPRLQRVLDALPHTPAFVKSATWDVLAWNRAAAVVLTDYSKIAASDRNVLRLLFSPGRRRETETEWATMARYVVGAFRADVARAGASDHVRAFIEELSRLNPKFAEYWAENDVRSYNEGTKTLRHSSGGITVEFSTFAVDGRADLALVILNPVTPQDAERIRRLVETGPAAD